MRIALLTLVLAACGSGTSNTNAADAQPTAVAVQAIYYTPGASWDPDKPPEEQNLGDHLAYVSTHVDDGDVFANGLFTTSPRGLYLIAGDATAAADFIANDPGVSQGVLAHERTESWSVMMSQLDSAHAQQTVWIARYAPGPSWQPGVPLAEQAVALHLAYVQEHFGQRVVLAGGPVAGGDDGGMYVIASADQADAQAFVDADPGIASEVFTPEIHGWALMNAGPIAGR